MTRGRPNKKLEHVESLDGGRREKLRLRLILSTLTGEESVDGASRRLRVTPTRFAKLRAIALQGAVEALAPRPVGRPPTMVQDREGAACRTLRKALERSERKRQVLQDLLDQGLRGAAGRERVRGGKKKRGRKPVMSE